MAKRRRQIKKQRKVSERINTDPRAADEVAEDVDEQVPDEELIRPQEERRGERAVDSEAQISRGDPGGHVRDDGAYSISGGWFAANKENILFGFLLLYVLLLGLGTAGELFEVEWILHLPIFK
ncbi:MAG: hypothetical protein GXP52_03190 [Deltaproteobacteria bacterium]|nr:hypothetical protein [Deltaproteobacteria bacterium]